MNLTIHQRRVLATLHAGKQPKHCPGATKRSLLKHGYVKPVGELLQITDQGKLILKAVVVQEPTLLAARFSINRGDYTDRPQLAMPDEPEAVDAAGLERIKRAGKVASRHRLDAETAEARLQLRQAIGALEARVDIGREAARRLARMRRDLARLEQELRAA